MFLTLFSIDGKLKLYIVFFTYLSIVPKIFTDFWNYCFINNPRFLPKNYSVRGYFFVVFLSKILFFFDF